MIARIRGVLEHLNAGSVLLGVEGALTYEVLLPAYALGRLGSDIGKEVSLHTLYFFESQNQGTTLQPRLAGFLTSTDREFFELFTTCKGIGYRKALRAMTLDTAQVATAIADRDAAFLQSLPEIGRRTAETIIATLHGKVDAFVAAGAASGPRDDGAARPASAFGGIGRDALDLFVQLGENQTQVIRWIDEALRQEESPADVEDLVRRVYQIKGGR